jgi:uncharacterized protein
MLHLVDVRSDAGGHSPPARGLAGAAEGRRWVAPAKHARQGGIRPLTLPAVAVVLLVAKKLLGPWLDGPLVETWTTVFVSVCLQALPFLVLGTTMSGALAAFVRPAAIERLMPHSPALAVPTAGLAGVAIPGCECGSVPVAGRLIACGAPPPAALTFLLAAPAINPVVLIATAIAFPGQPEIVGARFLASLATAVCVGWLWLAFGRVDLVDKARRHPPSAGSRADVFRATAVHDLLHAGGYLVVGGVAAATLRTLIPTQMLETLADTGPLAVLSLAGLAVVLAVCSEADAFVVAGLGQFSPTARLAFLVVGPAVDVKLIALHAGTFGRAFTRRFVPLTFLVALTSATAVGWVLL